MTFKDAIVQVLRSASRPMTTREVVEAVIELGAVTSGGKTPEATIRALLYSMARSTDNPRVRKLARKAKTRAARGSVRWVWDPTDKESWARAV